MALMRSGPTNNLYQVQKNIGSFNESIECFLEFSMINNTRATDTDTVSNTSTVHSTLLPTRRVSWGAVFAGVVLALAL